MVGERKGHACSSCPSHAPLNLSQSVNRKPGLGTRQTPGSTGRGGNKCGDYPQNRSGLLRNPWAGEELSQSCSCLHTSAWPVGQAWPQQASQRRLSEKRTKSRAFPQRSPGHPGSRMGSTRSQGLLESSWVDAEEMTPFCHKDGVGK